MRGCRAAAAAQSAACLCPACQRRRQCRRLRCRRSTCTRALQQQGKRQEHQLCASRLLLALRQRASSALQRFKACPWYLNLSQPAAAQALSKRGVDVAYVGNTSTVLAVGGYCPRHGNLLVWDALAPASAGPAGRLPHHAALVTALQVCRSCTPSERAGRCVRQSSQSTAWDTQR